LIEVLSISVDVDLPVCECGLIAIKRDLFDVLVEIGEVVVAVDLEKL
jgi:hypothetical protein